MWRMTRVMMRPDDRSARLSRQDGGAGEDAEADEAVEAGVFAVGDEGGLCSRWPVRRRTWAGDAADPRR
jgi:hypothetical protein